MTVTDLQEKKVGVLGFGTEGKAVVEYLMKHGITPVLFDVRMLETFHPDERAYITHHQLKGFFGDGYVEHFNEVEILFRSPGFHRLNDAVIAAEKRGLYITSQTDWFLAHCALQTVGITGTKGKGTTSSLLYEMLKAAELGTVYLTGNIGKVQPCAFIDEVQPNDVIVFELSSFQLQDIRTSPHVSVVLMVTEDHLDHHASLEEYYTAKQSIVEHQTSDDVTIFNIDYPASRAIGQRSKGQRFTISKQQPVERGAFIKDTTITITGFGDPLVLDCTDRKLRGAHNLENIAAASLVAASMAVPTEIMQQVIHDFIGLEHRLQFVASKHGIQFYNDSISTVPDTALAAVRSFTEPVVLILGGSDKGINFTTFAQALAQEKHVKAVALIGATGPKIQSALRAVGFAKPISDPVHSMQELSTQLHEIAAEGDIVLLSPACASLDMFTHYQERGQQFVKLVEEW